MPIVPEYHMRLFPDAERQATLFAGYEAHGNGLRKAYLSKAAIRYLAPGDLLYFYRSHSDRGVRVVGVIEDA